ncbi:multiple antibiotic resistance protein [Luteibacter sp. 621]|uniref:MarC family protein n=1 Tax=Luteibacter sp. 621 TaxID=3373916 RepID=UPI003D22A1B3
MSALAFLQGAIVVPDGAPQPMLNLMQVFVLLFVVMGPPLKTPLVYYARMLPYDHPTRRSLACKSAALAAVAILIGGFLGLSLQHNWQISPAAMLFAGGIIFLIVSLRTVLEQYSAPAHPQPVPPGTVPEKPALPTAFELAVPMIVTPYGLAGLIILLGSSHSLERTLAIVALVLLVVFLHLLAMLFAGPIVRGIGPMPFRLFGVVIGSLTVGLSIQMLILAFHTAMNP